MQDLVDGGFEERKTEQVGADAEHDSLTELLRLLGQSNTAAAKSSSGHAGIGAAQLPSDLSGGGRDERRLRCGRETIYPYGDPLAAADLVPPRRHSDEQSSQSASPAAARAHAHSPYQAKGNTPADDHTSADPHPLLWQPRVPRGMGLAIIGIAASALVGILAGVGYYALSPSNTIGEALAIGESSAQTKSTATGQNASAEELDPQAVGTSWSDEPKKVRTVSIRRDGGAAETPSAQSSTTVSHEVKAAPMPRARPSGKRPPAE